MTLAGKVALVTGGSRGLGRAACLELAARGADVLVHHRDSAGEAAATVAGVEALGRRGLAVRADLGLAADVAALFDACEAFGAPDILVNNVGDFVIRGVAETTDAEWDRLFRSNVDSVFRCSRGALPAMRERRWGRIVNLGAAAVEPRGSMPGQGVYHAAKAAVLALSRALAVEEAAFGITVNVVAPGIIDTGAVGPKTREHPGRLIPMARLGRPEEVARAVAFLAEPDSGYITGAFIPVAGGYGL